MIRVRLATADDVEAARSIVTEYNESIGVVKRDDEAHFEKYIVRPNAFWFAETGEDTAGCVALRDLPELRACEVKRLYVRPDYRRGGVAAELMDAVESYARDNGYDAIYLDTFDALDAAVRFYERRGYERIPRYNENPQATIFMRKLLM